MNQDRPANSFSGFPIEEVERSIPERFEKIVRLHPERTAVKKKSRALTYGDLNSAANRIAHSVLMKRGPGSEPVALLFDHDVDVVAAILGVLKAGKFYIALDPGFPIERNRFLLKNSQAGLILTNTRHSELSSELTGKTHSTIDTDEIRGASCIGNPCIAISPNQTAHLLYTSGSTGEPKGVAHSHRSYLYRTAANTAEMQVTPADRLSLLHSVGSGSSRLNFFLSLLNGSLLDLFDIKAEGAHRLLRWIKEDAVTICHLPPAVFRQLADMELDSDIPPTLRLISLSGAPITREDFELYKKTFSRSTLLRIYMGTSETVEVSSCVVGPDFHYPDWGVPIGYPAPGKKVLLLNDSGDEVRPGEKGEIAVRSRYLPTGYWHRPDLTRAKFLTDPEEPEEGIYRTSDLARMMPSGFLLHFGRKDLMVKVRGYRVELGEIEAALSRIDLVKTAVVRAQPDRERDQRLVAYIVPVTGETPTQSEIRRRAERFLPDYMIPSAFVFLETLPLLPNGKVDRGALPDPGKSRPELTTAYVAPKTAVEAKLAQIWSEVLGLDQVGARDNFFELGGHSLAAARLVSRIIRSFKINLPITAIFESPTVAEMAKVIAEHQEKPLGEEELGRILAELDLMPEEEAKWLLSSRAESTKRKQK